MRETTPVNESNPGSLVISADIDLSQKVYMFFFPLNFVYAFLRCDFIWLSLLCA